MTMDAILRQDLLFCGFADMISAKGLGSPDTGTHMAYRLHYSSEVLDIGCDVYSLLNGGKT
jgi:hypothetical protein